MNAIEKNYCHEFQENFSRDSWLLANSESFRFKDVPTGVRRGEKRVKAVAGLIRAVLLEKDDRIYDLILTGDFHPRPHTILADMEASLRGGPAQPEEIAKRIREIYHQNGVEISGTTVEDFIKAVTGALEEASKKKGG
jgi:hypothetical protein